MEIEELTKAIVDRDDAMLKRLATVEEETQDVRQKSNGVVEQVADLEQKLARGDGHGRIGPHKTSWGEEFAAAPEVKAFAGETTRPGRVRIAMKTTMDSTPTSAGSLAPSERDKLVTLPQRRMTVRNLLPSIRVSSGSVEYPKQTDRTNAAAPVAEAALKPESGLAFDLVTTPIRTIAHWIPAARQILEDSPQLAGLIDTELKYGLALREEAQLLSGDGTGQNLLGLIPQAAAFAAPFAIPSPTLLDTVGLAILQSALAEQPADGVVMHPSDWMRIRLLKNADGDYILGPPGSDVPAVLFGLPVVATQAMAMDKFLVGNFEMAGTIFDRWEPRIEVSTEHADFFVRNLIAILAEERIGLAVKHAEALTYGDFGLVA